MVERSQRWKHRIMKRRRNRSEREGDKERERDSYRGKREITIIIRYLHIDNQCDLISA
jgi:hypothetical protein